jgi:hypothetical protein
MGVHIQGNKFDGYSRYNHISKNIFINNWEVGVQITSWAYKNQIFHNNFVNNSINAKVNSNYENWWDNFESGNYWDDYDGEDNDGDGIGDTLYRIETYNNDHYPLMEPYVGFDPDAPDAPEIVGPYKGESGVAYDYLFVTTDPNEDDVYYYITWGDGTYEDWFGPLASGDPVTLNHSWEEEGRYSIIVRAKDINGLIGPWNAFTISMPRTRASQCWLDFLERYPIMNKLLFLLVV